MESSQQSGCLPLVSLLSRLHISFESDGIAVAIVGDTVWLLSYFSAAKSLNFIFELQSCHPYKQHRLARLRYIYIYRAACAYIEGA